MTKEQFRQIVLVRESKKGNKAAQQQLLKSISNFVVQMAKKKCGNRFDIVEDLYQVGMLSILERAIPMFDESLNLTFLNYAVHWLNSSMNLYLNTNTSLPFRLPNNIALDFRKANAGCTPEYDITFNLIKMHRVEHSIDSKDIWEVIPEESKSDDTDIDKKYILKEILNSHKFKGKNLDRFKRYYCIGEYNGFPPITTKEMALDEGVNEQDITNSIKDVRQYIYRSLKIKQPEKRKAIA